MPVLPLPLIVSLLLLGLLAQRLSTRRGDPALLGLILACAVQSALIALVQYYGLSGFRVLQPVLAGLITAVAWLAFRRATKGTLGPRDIALHMLSPLAVLLSQVLFPAALDVIIPLIFAGYALAIGATLMSGEDSVPHSRLENGETTLVVWRVLALALLASALSDVVIAVRLGMGDGTVLLWLPSVLSSATLLVLGALGLSHAIESQSAETEPPVSYSAEDRDRDTGIMARLEAYVRGEQPYLDPDLTLSRLSRQLRIPEKQVSAAVNKATGENVSRYINGYRIAHACTLMEGGASVTEAMLSSGFNTKSNFNREFLRVMGASPTAWRKGAGQA